MTWLRAVEGLARCGPSEVAEAQLQLKRLAGIARAIGPHLHEGVPHGPECLLADRPHGERLCALTPQLAGLDVASASVDATGADELARRLHEAVVDAVDTVRWCRQTAHPGGACWFLSAQGGDCGDVLKLGHLLAGSAN